MSTYNPTLRFNDPSDAELSLELQFYDLDLQQEEIAQFTLIIGIPDRPLDDE